MYKIAIGSEFNVHSFFKTIKYKLQYRRSHPDEFTVNGILCFSGRQGNGKTLTAIKYIKDILKDYPKCIVVSNVDIHGVDVIRYTGLADFLKINNDDKGIILFFDEISNQFNSVTSKDIDPEWFTIINMQRKRHIHIIGTCPILSRVGKAFREQFDVICLCEQYLFGTIQWNHYYINNCFALQDGEDIKNGLKHYKRQFYFIDPKYFENYDTYEVVKVVTENKTKNKASGFITYD
ncbi:MAG: ATP-binding protein [Clostridia bacterium]|nr:ATP-binding protein [Clostridia bacterium]